MDKAFDTKVLFEDVKVAGLPLLEKDVEVMTAVVFDWLDKSVDVLAVSQPFMAFVKPLLAQLKTAALKEADKIDGQVG